MGGLLLFPLLFLIGNTIFPYRSLFWLWYGKIETCSLSSFKTLKITFPRVSSPGQSKVKLVGVKTILSEPDGAKRQLATLSRRAERQKFALTDVRYLTVEVYFSLILRIIFGHISANSKVLNSYHSCDKISYLVHPRK